MKEDETKTGVESKCGVDISVGGVSRRVMTPTLTQYTVQEQVVDPHTAGTILRPWNDDERNYSIFIFGLRYVLFLYFCTLSYIY